MRVTDLSLMLASEAIKFVPAQGSPGSASDQVRRIDASKNNAGITVAVHLLPAAMGVQCPEAHAALSTLLRLLLSIPDPAGKQAEMHASEIFTGSHFNASALYGVIKPHGNEPMLQGDVDGLVCTLRPFQRRSVQWMLSREQCASLASSSKSTPQQRNSLFKTLPVIDSACVTRKIFVNQLTGQFQLQPPAPLAAITGGCLCEEMGLGKTVEVIACILRHPCPAPTRLRDLPDRIARIPKKARIACMPCGTTVANPHDVAAESYNGTWVQCDGCAAWMHGACIGFRGEPDHLLCGECLRKLAQQEVQGTSKATLIVCPDAILKQWQSEIARHGAPGALKVIVYGGQSASCTSSLRGMPVTATDLAAADIVVTTYAVLRHDLDFEASATGGSRPTRHARKYPVLPTPLTRLCWWRVILDEAQMVESATKAAEMAVSLHMVNRWCVTGTPISGGVADVYGLVRFLQMEPWSDKKVWERVLQRPVEAGDHAAQAALLRLLQPARGGIMWRTSKESVARELGIPAQEAVVQRLQLTPVEWHAYRRCHKETAEHAQKVLPEGAAAAMATSGAVLPSLQRTLTVREADSLFPKLVRLRQTCCHPQIGQRGGGGGAGTGGAGTGGAASTHPAKTMSAVLHDLVERDRGEAQEAQRVLLAALNGLAGLVLLQGRARDAVELYGKVLEHVRTNAGVCDVDRLQEMHVMANLGAVGKTHPKAVAALGVTAADSQARAATLQRNYLGESFANMAAAAAEYAGARTKLSKACSRLQHLNADRFLTGTEVDKADAWWWCTLSRVTAVCEPDSARLQIERAERARIAAAEAKKRAAEDAKRRAEEEAAEAAARGDSPTPTATPSKAGSSRGSPSKRSTPSKGVAKASTSKSPGKSPGKGVRKSAGQGNSPARKGKERAAKGGRIPDEWDSDDSEFEDEDEEVSSEEEEEEEPEEEGMEERIVRFFKEHLDAATNAYNAATTANALSVRGRFHTVAQLRDVLRTHFQKLNTLQTAVLSEVERLDPVCRAPPKELHERAGACEQCHGAAGMPGVTCVHCDLERQVIRWEARLFRFSARSLKVGATVSEEQALEMYRQELMSGGPDGSGGAQSHALRTQSGIASVAMTGQDNDHTVLLHAIILLLRKPASDVVSVPSTTEAERTELVGLAQAQIAELAASRALFFKARQAIVRQRSYLHKHDELAMCTARLALRGSGDYSPMREQLYLYKDEVPVRIKEIMVEKAVAEADYKAAIGQLRYALNLQRDRGQEAPPSGGPSPAAAAPGIAAAPSAIPAASTSVAAVAAADAAARADIKPGEAKPAGNPPPEAAAAGGAANTGAAAAVIPSTGTSSAVLLDDSDDDCVIVEGLGVERGATESPAPAAKKPRKAPAAAFTAAAPNLAAPSWEAGAASSPDGSGDRSAGEPPAGTPPSTSPEGPVAPRVKLGAKLEAMLRKLDEPAPPGTEECPVCNEFMMNECMLSTCGHRWCSTCHTRMKKLNRGLDGRLKCPLCTKSLAVREVTLVSLREPAGGDPDDGSGGADLMNSFGTKLDAVVKCVQDTLRDKPNDKMLVFSAWSEVLDLLAHSLSTHSVPYLVGKGKDSLQKALDVFDSSRAAADAGVERAGGATIQRPRGLAGRRQRTAGGSDEEPRVLLLQLKQAAAGLNLVLAQHVLLIEPSTNPAVEAQAVARVHRMNQKSETRVVRFVVEGTVEAALAQLTAAKAAQMDMASSSAPGHRAAAAEPKLTVADVAAMLFHKQVRQAAA
eukprot:jgi/Ulvmu1/11282/UM073_0054.1